MTNHVRSVFLIRHGRTSYNAAHKLQGQVDIPLDAVGEWQVKQTAAALKRLYVDRRQEINHRFIVCSDLKRAHATAQAFADVLGGIEPVDDRRVRERSFGDWDGHAVAELAERYPDKNFIGVDIKGARMWRGAKTATEQEMRNAGFLRTRIEFIDSCFAPGEVDEFDYGEPDLEDEQLTEDQKRDMLGLVHDYAMNTSELARTMLDCQHFDDPQVRELVRQTFKDLECAGSHVSDALKLMGWTADDATVG